MSTRSTEEPRRLDICFIGIGVMGSAVARNLLEDGHRLTLHSRTRSRAADLEEAGALWAQTPGGAAVGADVIFTMVPDSAAVSEVVAGPEGVLSTASPGSVWVDLSSIAPQTSRELAALARESGVEALDAPVSGGAKGAAARTLSLMVGGEADTLARVLPLLGTISSTVTHVGGHGAGQVTKVCNQMIVGATMCAVAEALVLAQKCGVDPAQVRQAISGGTARSHILEDHGRRMLERTFTPGFRVSLLQKDLATAVETAMAAGSSALSAAQAAQLMVAVGGRYGDVDASSVVRLYEEFAGTGPLGAPDTEDGVTD